jgi:hypothetical protein
LFDTTPISRFYGASCRVHGLVKLKKMRVSWYQSIEMCCIVLPVKFDGMLSILVLRNQQLFTKNCGFKTDQFQKAQILEIFSNPAILKKDRPSIPLAKGPLLIVIDLDSVLIVIVKLWNLCSPPALFATLGRSSRWRVKGQQCLRETGRSLKRVFFSTNKAYLHILPNYRWVAHL